MDNFIWETSFIVLHFFIILYYQPEKVQLNATMAVTNVKDAICLYH